MIQCLRLTMIADTPTPPYYAVIFTSKRTSVDNGYNEMSDRMIELASQEDGFLGIESAREEYGITVSYWKDLESINNWRNNMEHKIAKERGRKEWYLQFKIRIAKVELDTQFSKY